MKPIKRTPIIIKRTPIIKERLNWDEVYAKFIKLIHFAAYNVSNQFKTESAEDLTQEGQLMLYKCWLLYGDKDWDNFAPIFKASLWRKLRELSAKKYHFTSDIEDLKGTDAEPTYVEDLDSELDSSMKLSQLSNLVSGNEIVQAIFNELVNPSESTLWECEMDWARKNTLSSMGYNVAVPKSITLSKKAIKRSLKKAGITGLEFDKGMSQLRDLAADVYGIPKY